MQKLCRYVLLVICCAVLAACATVPPSANQRDAQREAVREMAAQTLDSLYAQYPDAKAKVESAAGYAVFTNYGLKFFIFGGANGQGVAIDNADKKATYMKMVELQPGLGLGAQKFRVVFLFGSKSAFNSFVNSGWELGANAMAAVKSTNQGEGGQLGANVAQDVTLYQLSDKGAIVGVSVTAGKYYRDDELN